MRKEDESYVGREPAEVGDMVEMKEHNACNHKNIVGQSAVVKDTDYKSTADAPKLNIRYSFAGRHARTADESLLGKAIDMAEGGESKESILKETGWFVGPDGKWRAEISDKNTEFKMPKLLTEAEVDRMTELMLKRMTMSLGHKEKDELKNLEDMKMGYELGEVLSHNTLFTAYPGLKKMGVMFSYNLHNGQALYNPEFKIIMLGAGNNERIGADKMQRVRIDSLLHEIQHAIQDMEGFALGANERLWDKAINEGYTKISSRTGEPMTELELYMNSSGEIEAREVVHRKEMTDAQRRENFPYSAMKNPDRVFSDELIAKEMGSLCIMRSNGELAEERFKNPDISEAERKEVAKTILAKRKVKEEIRGDVLIRVVDEDAYTDDMKEIVSIGKRDGYNVSFFIGEGLYRHDDRSTLKIDGMVVNSNDIYLQYDGVHSPQSIYLHEEVHGKWSDEGTQGIKKLILGSLSEDKKRKILEDERYKQYIELYDGDMEEVWQEYIADKLSGINSYTPG